MPLKTLFRKTFTFVAARFCLSLLAAAFPAAFLPIFIGAGWLFGANGAVFAIFIWLPFALILHLLILRGPGLLLRFGHLTAALGVLSFGKAPRLQLFRCCREALVRYARTNTFSQFSRNLFTKVRQLYLQKGEPLFFFRHLRQPWAQRLPAMLYLSLISRFLLCRIIGEKNCPAKAADRAAAEWLKKQPSAKKAAEKIIGRTTLFSALFTGLLTCGLWIFFARISFYPFTALPLALLFVSSAGYFAGCAVELSLLILYRSVPPQKTEAPGYEA